MVRSKAVCTVASGIGALIGFMFLSIAIYLIELPIADHFDFYLPRWWRIPGLICLALWTVMVVVFGYRWLWRHCRQTVEAKP
jgi:uncharacterized BrkB/YihY/UPF0761 family membrane protein